MYFSIATFTSLQVCYYPLCHFYEYDIVVLPSYDDYSFLSLTLSDSRIITFHNSGSSQSKLFCSQCHGRPACCQVISHQHKLRKKTHFCKFRNSKHNYCKFRNSKHNYEAFITHTHITITIVYVCRYFRTKWAPILEI